MDSPDPPPAPDYTATAERQGEINRGALAAQTYANRPTQITPWGRMDWTTGSAVDPATGEPVTTWTQRQQLDPRAQATLEAQMGLGQERTALAQDIFGRTREALGQPFDFGQLSPVTGARDLRQQAEEAAYLRSTSRLDPQFERAGAQLEVNLRNKGLRPGDEAYDAEVANFERAKADAYATARMDATAAGRAESAQMFGQQEAQRARELSEALRARGMPLDEVNMLVAGQGVQPPSMPGVSYAGMAQPANLMGAASMTHQANIDAYNAQQAQRQSMLGGMFGLGRLAMTGYGMGMFG